MTRSLRALLLTTAALLLPLSVSADSANYKEGEHYEPTSQRMAKNTSSEQIEVMELFSYSCPHCFTLDSQIMQWKETLPENVKFTQVPAIFRDSWLQLARVFYAAQVTGDLDKLHKALFNAIHIDKRRLDTEERLLDFVAEQGIDREKFAETMNSFTVKTNVKKALVISQTAGVSGVPSIIVDGRYHTDAPKAGSMTEMLKVVEHLIEKVEAEK
ncbi:thiol:disulfide interchange protein DsbA/DsbL [Methylophaga sp.]|uniref:thiol:disulfide interchange protein DsbA/DsbL n=1 Tax=Methylophaga sp. TaxID=2024840 RepID=UPI00271D04B7|nr:thiol:disulfide interchange protein DsbA/DsbL [Methylophaga sp.]MDO8825822.1 thiol:disulfide interchange protein DsbA/DsbL [Methylophaga sp.]